MLSARAVPRSCSSRWRIWSSSGSSLDRADELRVPLDFNQLPPDLRTPDLMGFFKAAQQKAEDRPFSEMLGRPSAQEVFASAQLHPGQQSLLVS